MSTLHLRVNLLLAQKYLPLAFPCFSLLAKLQGPGLISGSCNGGGLARKDGGGLTRKNGGGLTRKDGGGLTRKDGG